MNNSHSGRKARKKRLPAQQVLFKQRSLGLQLSFLQTEKPRTLTQHLFAWDSNSASGGYSQNLRNQHLPLPASTHICLERWFRSQILQWVPDQSVSSEDKGFKVVLWGPGREFQWWLWSYPSYHPKTGQGNKFPRHLLKIVRQTLFRLCSLNHHGR